MSLDLIGSFVLGLLTPLTAVCVMPLYPGYLSYLSNRFSEDVSRKTYAMFGALVVAGVMMFMLSLGLVFSALLQQSLTNVIQIVSPLAFGALGFISILMILDYNPFSEISGFNSPSFQNPILDGLGFGFFFGAIVIPCNPAFISAFFARSFLFESPVANLLNFTAFGLGIGFPLFAFSIISSKWSSQIVGFLTDNKSLINRSSGLLMLAVSIYYLLFVFRIFGPLL